MWNYLKFLILFAITSLVYGADMKCASKHLYPINEDNYEILQCNVTRIFRKKTGIYPKLITLDNNGETVFIRSVYNAEKPTISEGPYGEDVYQLEFMYFNGLDDQYTGSNGTLPFELHVVFANQKYGLFERAVKKNFGITVWSYRYELMDPKWINERGIDHGVHKMYSYLQYIREPNTKYDVNFTIYDLPSLNSLIRYPLEYFVYQGRLTPILGDCNTDVIWLEFPRFIKIFSKHAELLQQILSANKPPLKSFVQYDAPTGPIYQNIDHYKYQEEGLSAQSFEKFKATSNDSDNDDDNDVNVETNNSFRPGEKYLLSIIFFVISWIFGYLDLRFFEGCTH